MKRSCLLRLHAKRLLLTAIFLVGLLGNSMAQNPVSRNATPDGPVPARTKVIFDCDLGDDIEDAYALALLCATTLLVVIVALPAIKSKREEAFQEE